MKEFLSPLSKSVIPDDEQSCGSHISIYTDDLPDYENADIALIGLKSQSDDQNACQAIREAFYNLKSNSYSYAIVDLGDIKPGATAQDTLVAVSEVCKTVLAENTIPVVIGGDVQMGYGQFRAFQTIARNVECSVIAPDLALDTDEYLHNICVHEPNFLFNINALGYQSHYVTPKEVSTLQNMYFTAMRLGMLRQDRQEVEPILRNTDVVLFDMNAIKYSDAPGVAQANPNGLTSDEACQLAWYSGISDKMRSFGLYNLDLSNDIRNITTNLAAQILWYFVDGYYNRKGDHPTLHNDFTKYRCTMMNNEPDVVFYKSKRTERWWLELPGNSKSITIPCSYNDYVTATKGEMPEVFFRGLQKALK